MKLDKIKKLESKIVYSVRQKEEEYIPQDFSKYSDEEFFALYDEYMLTHPIEHDPELDGLSEQELCDLYLKLLKVGEDGHDSSTKKSKKSK